mgnify:CR=1 FL=1
MRAACEIEWVARAKEHLQFATLFVFLESLSPLENARVSLLPLFRHNGPQNSETLIFSSYDKCALKSGRSLFSISVGDHYRRCRGKFYVLRQPLFFFSFSSIFIPRILDFCLYLFFLSLGIYSVLTSFKRRKIATSNQVGPLVPILTMKIRKYYVLRENETVRNWRIRVRVSIVR